MLQAKRIADELKNVMLRIHHNDAEGERCCADFIQEIQANSDALSVGGLFYLTKDYIVTVG